MPPRLLLALALALSARIAGAASPLALERDLERTTAEHERLITERRRLQPELLALAERIDALKATASTTRAGGDLLRRLRDFDRVALRLDALERGLADQEQRAQRLRAEFEAAADVDERRLEERAHAEGAAAVSPLLEALGEARRRVAAQAAPAVFRPPLAIAIEPLDPPSEIEAKIALIDGEVARIGGRVAELQGEEALLTRRVEARREWARQLASARRDGAGAVELLDRGYEDAQASLRELAARADRLARERAALDSAQQGLRARRTEAEGRLRELRGTR